MEKWLKDMEKAAVEAHIRLEEGEGLSFLNIFKAGAEWALSQGITKEVPVNLEMASNLPGESSYSATVSWIENEFNTMFDNTVLVQVRKK